MKNIAKIFIILLIFFSLFIIGSCSNPDREFSSEENEDLPVLTIEELSKFDGKNSNSAYVAVEGLIYDVTGLEKWKDGEHNGYQAGKDLTDVILNKSPHGVSKLKNVPIVGKLKK